MEYLGTCRFCDIIHGKYKYSGIDQPFAENNEYIAVASIGAMIEGWSLIIPKQHQLSMRTSFKSPEFVDFAGIVIPKLASQYGSIIAFEHGSNQEGSLTACGTDHAHLHLVPFKESLLPELQASELEWVRCHSSEVPERVGNKEYLFYSELGSQNNWSDPIGYLHILEYPISQYFRHLIAERIGYSGASDYRQFPYLEAARETRRMLTV